MRASVFLLGFLASLSYAMPKAAETCREPTSSCSKIATWGQPMACCYPLECVTQGNNTIGVCPHQN
ncbi:uncharacterized protein N7477_005072 [Penicillium maclennaniae]|uniref:uncharacterized protein n=1 Tax=Penicillium maclennaniae TaxID=1343394 RepID=UPI0025425C2F|nr:uncharacterized protein N7477_005072 [Penicillium maclennaniae]KAJ5675138.1 hypothetical protein N7477_005072 [Penicillium maclennaniae]